MDAWEIELLDDSHQRSEFDCGQAPLDELLKKYARQNARLNISRTYVAVVQGEKRVCGYYTLSAAKFARESMPDDLSKKLPRYPVPAFLIGRLAVDRSFQRKGLGAFLLRDAFRRCLTVSQQIGAFAVVVSAKDEVACDFYRKYGFTSFEDNEFQLFIPIKTIADSLE